MKHVLNFKPTTIYRTGSSFLLKNALLLLYVIPIMMFAYHYYEYDLNVKLTQTYKEAAKRLNDKIVEHKEKFEKRKPDSETLEKLKTKYYDYRILSSVSRNSLSVLLDRLEKISDPQIKFSRISIRPEKLLTIKLDGKTPDLVYLTDFLRDLYADTVFLEPVIKSHRKVRTTKTADEYEIDFVLELKYLGESGELP